MAVKILAIHAFLDSDRKERFVREARIASALNHPDIVHVYDVDQTADGIDYIVMEYVKGKSLAALISGRWPAFDLVRQIRQPSRGSARGSTSEGYYPSRHQARQHHDRGGRNRKSIGLWSLDPDRAGRGHGSRKNGAPSVLGRGCSRADARRVHAGMGRGGHGPIHVAGTDAGEPCDARSDIFSFGSLLYEMVTGDRAFVGDAAATLMSAILRDQPKPARENAKEVPPQLEQVIQRCLQKQADRRFQCMHDVKVALQEISETAAVSEIPAKGGERRHRAAAAGVAALLILGVGAGLGRMLKPSPPAPPTPPQVVLLSRDADYAGFSPDGKWLVYAAYRSGNMELFKRRADGGDETRLTATSANETQPAWSRDGWIAFVSDRDGGGIWEISADHPEASPCD